MAVERGDLDRQYIVGEQGRNRKSEAITQNFFFNLSAALWQTGDLEGGYPGSRVCAVPDPSGNGPAWLAVSK